MSALTEAQKRALAAVAAEPQPDPPEPTLEERVEALEEAVLPDEAPAEADEGDQPDADPADRVEADVETSV